MEAGLQRASMLASFPHLCCKSRNTRKEKDIDSKIWLKSISTSCLKKKYSNF